MSGEREPCWLCGDLGGVAVHERWTWERRERRPDAPPLWTPHEPVTGDHPHGVRPCPACAKDDQACEEIAELATELADERTEHNATIKRAERTEAANRRVRALAEKAKRDAHKSFSRQFGGGPFPAALPVDEVLAALDHPEESHG